MTPKKKIKLCPIPFKVNRTPEEYLEGKGTNQHYDYKTGHGIRTVYPHDVTIEYGRLLLKYRADEYLKKAVKKVDEMKKGIEKEAREDTAKDIKELSKHETKRVIKVREDTAQDIYDFCFNEAHKEAKIWRIQDYINKKYLKKQRCHHAKKIRCKQDE